MKSIISFLICLVSLLSSVSAAVADGNKAGHFTLSPVVGGYSFDGTQHQETRPVYGIRGGYNFTSNFGAEALFDYVQSVGTQTNIGDIHVYRYGGDLLWHFMPDSKLVPYLAAGYSALTTDYEELAFLGGAFHFHHTKGAADYGAGFKYYFTDDLALRGDFRHIITKDQQTLSNYEYTVGFTYHFDKKQLASLFQRAPESEEALDLQPEPEPVKPSGLKPESKVAPALTPGAQPEPAPAGEPGIQPESGTAVEKEAPLAPFLAAEPMPGINKLCVTLHIEFDIGSTAIRPEFYKDLAMVGDFMKKNPTTTAIVEGHTDNVGNFQTNMNVSLQRAETVVNYLVQQLGIEPSRLFAKGYGSTRPVADNSTILGQEKNRRIEVIFDCPLDVKATEFPTGLFELPAQFCLSLQIEFDSGKVDIKPKYHDEIAKIGDFMKKYPATSAVIEGHTDNVGGYEYNMKLSLRRAESVVRYLEKHFGIEQSRLLPRGYGYTRRIAYNNTSEGRQKNRRINAVIECVINK